PPCRRRSASRERRRASRGARDHHPRAKDAADVVPPPRGDAGDPTALGSSPSVLRRPHLWPPTKDPDANRAPVPCVPSNCMEMETSTGNRAWVAPPRQWATCTELVQGRGLGHSSATAAPPAARSLGGLGGARSPPCNDSAARATDDRCGGSSRAPANARPRPPSA